jgi:hypothetical protein
MLEAGFVLFAVGCVAGFAALIGGRLRGDAARRERHHEPAPTPGSIPSERHQQLTTSPR